MTINVTANMLMFSRYDVYYVLQASHPEGNVNVCTTCRGNPSNSCGDCGVVDSRPTRATLLILLKILNVIHASSVESNSIVQFCSIVTNSTNRTILIPDQDRLNDCS